MEVTTSSRNAPRSQGQRARRPRAARACDLCRSKKNKCDESYPCSYCRSRHVQCVYQGQQPSSRRYTDEYVKQLEEQVKRLTTVVLDSPIAHLAGPDHQAIPENASPLQHPSESSVTRSAGRTGEEEISGVNRHTSDTEFYGSSSSVALLSCVQRTGDRLRGDEDAGHLVSSLHNPAFRASPITTGQGAEPETELYCAHHYPQCRKFIEDFFQTIHYVHPILDKREFCLQCETLWSATPATNINGNSSSSFTALYYSILSLGAIVGLRDEEPIDGLSNLQWSRKFFDIARRCCNQLGLVTDLEMVQCYFFMGKVCQNELNPHWSYMYVGFAVRTALAMGINREPGAQTRKHSNQLKAESRTWWGLYSLETEVSFSIGRPDTLGADLHHNRRLPLVKRDAEDSQNMDSPLVEPQHCAIINCMVDLSRITRTICHKIYLANAGVADMVTLTNQIEKNLDGWRQGLPKGIRPPLQQQHQQGSLRAAKDAQWVKRQRMVLNIRYHNLRILLFGALLLRSPPAGRTYIAGCQENILKCLDSAKLTISIIYQIYEHNDFFQTWFYNTTYTVFAASVILLYITQDSATNEEVRSLLQFVNMAVEILEIMEECVVAIEAAKLLRRAREKTESKLTSEPTAMYRQETNGNTTPEGDAATSLPTHFESEATQLNNYWGPLGLIDGSGMDFDIAFQLGAFDQNNPMFLPMDEQ